MRKWSFIFVIVLMAVPSHVYLFCSFFLFELAGGPAARPEGDVGAPGQEKSEAPESPEPPGELPAAVRSVRPVPPPPLRTAPAHALLELSHEQVFVQRRQSPLNLLVPEVHLTPVSVSEVKGDLSSRLNFVTGLIPGRYVYRSFYLNEIKRWVLLDLSG